MVFCVGLMGNWILATGTKKNDKTRVARQKARISLCNGGFPLGYPVDRFLVPRKLVFHQASPLLCCTPYFSLAAREDLLLLVLQYSPSKPSLTSFPFSKPGSDRTLLPGLTAARPASRDKACFMDPEVMGYTCRARGGVRTVTVHQGTKGIRYHPGATIKEKHNALKFRLNLTFLSLHLMLDHCNSMMSVESMGRHLSFDNDLYSFLV